MTTKVNKHRGGTDDRIKLLSFHDQLTWLEHEVKQLKEAKDVTVLLKQQLTMMLSLAESVKAAQEHHLDCAGVSDADAELLADDAARHVEYGGPGVGIHVRAKHARTGQFDTYDITDLTRESLMAWLRSRGGHNEWAERVVLILLGHEKI